MSALTRIFRWLYTQSLNLYPFEFRAKFEAEMGDVFSQATHESIGNAMNFCLREVKRFTRQSAPAALACH